MSFVGLKNFIQNREGFFAGMIGVTAKKPPIAFDGFVYIDYEAQTLEVWENGAYIVIASGGGGGLTLQDVTTNGITTDRGMQVIGGGGFFTSDPGLLIYFDGSATFLNSYLGGGVYGGMELLASYITLLATGDINLTSASGNTNVNLNTVGGTGRTQVFGNDARYDQDYSAGYTARSIPDKAYTDAFATAAVTALLGNNGITRTGNNFGLGGTITATTILSNNNQTLWIGTRGQAGGTAIQQINSTGAAVMNIGVVNVANAFGNYLRIDGQTNIITVFSSNGGLRNAADYSASFVLESLITKRYGDNLQATAVKTGQTTITGNGVTTSFTVTHGAGFTPTAVVLSAVGAPTTFTGTMGEVANLMGFLGTDTYTATQFTIKLSPAIVASFGLNSQTVYYTCYR